MTLVEETKVRASTWRSDDIYRGGNCCECVHQWMGVMKQRSSPQLIKHLFINDYTEQYKVNTLGVKGGSHFSQLHSAFAKILLVVDLSSSLQCER